MPLKHDSDDSGDTDADSPQTDWDQQHRHANERLASRLEHLWRRAASRDPVATSQADSLFAAPPFRLNQFSIQSKLGAGAFGVVFLAIDERLGRLVALKIPRIEVLVDTGKRQRFESEANAAAALDHPHIVPVYEAHFTGAQPYIASAYVAGPDLGQWLDSRKQQVDWPSAAAFVARLADAVHYAHLRGVFHRDLKPANVLLEPTSTRTTDSLDEASRTMIKSLDDCVPRLVDFGLAKLADQALADTRSSVLLGTPAYMAPEQLHPVSAVVDWSRTDIYALGCMLYELISGRMPVAGQTFIEVADRLRDAVPTRLRKLVPGTPRDIEFVVAKCLEKEPPARYASAEQLANDLRACLAGAPIQAKSPSVWARFCSWSRQPSRIRDAGRFMVAFHLVVAVWVTLIAWIVPSYNLLSPDQYFATFRDMAAVCVFVHLPGAWIGYLTLLRKPWAYGVGFIFSLLNCFGTLAQILGIGYLLFEFPYQLNDFFRVQIESFILIGLIVQTALYWFALRANSRLKKLGYNSPL